VSTRAVGAAAALACGVLVVGCGSPYAGATVGAQVQSWIRATGFAAALGTLRADARRITTVETRRDTKALHTDCDVLVDDALNANQQLPAPDSELTGLLSDAYAAAAQAGRRCATVAADDTTALAGVHTQLGRAAAGYIKAQARIDVVEQAGS
jgi:hypothetical protein